MRITSVPSMAVLAGLGLALATPALAETAAEIDAGVEAARDTCAADVVGCETAAEKAQGMLVFPKVTKGAIGVGGSYGEGALIVDDKTQAYYSTAAASIGLQLGGETYSQIVMFMTREALDAFRNSSGWKAGANAKVAMIDQGKAADLSSVIASNPVIAFVFGQQGLIGDLSVEGAKISKLDR
jgi:lipid-binding SYLF domain-containing protein